MHTDIFSDSCCVLFRKTSPKRGLVYLAICAHLPLNGAGIEARRFYSEHALECLLKDAGVQDDERARILEALNCYGRTLTRLNQAGAAHLRSKTQDVGARGAIVPAKPTLFSVPRVTARATSYRMLGRYNQSDSDGGVLRAGEEVWLAGTAHRTRSRAYTRAFVDGIGLITLDTRWLTLPDRPVSFGSSAENNPILMVNTRRSTSHEPRDAESNASTTYSGLAE